ncbi:thioesterase-like superfamily-domain-containing protein [Aspergillus aurantiobrunneus]
MKPRRSKRTGRPRLDASSDAAVLSDDRRAQIRRAQHAYRQKKETIFKNATARADRLEASMRSAVEEISGLSAVAADAQLYLSHPDIYARLMRLRGILADDKESIEMGSSPVEPSPESGPASNTLYQSAEEYTLISPLPTRQHTYAFQESRFARQLQRFCLEHAYRLFTEPQSDPRALYRVFRLVPCVKDPGKTEPRFRQLLMGGQADALELAGLPLYCIGGAGTHFPDVDKEGNPVYPVNSRMPRRILGLAHGAEPRIDGYKQDLVAYGLDGEWFDCRDVEGYLRRQGVDVTGEMFPAMHMPGDGSQSFVLDVEGFFSRLLSGLVILGRAPGFRKTDVRRALADWAYGGNILAIAVAAAYATVTPGRHLHSISGHFVRPASPSQKLIYRVERIRDTRTFETRHLRVVQSGEKSERLCLVATADFQTNEPADMVMVNYSARPQLPVPSAPAAETATEKTREPGLYSILDTMMELHPHKADRNRKGREDVPEMVSAERFRLHEARLLHTEAEHIAALALYMDRGLAYIPANHSGYSLAQASTCATLDFALRLLTNGADLQNWHIGERQSFGAGNARALSEGRVFDADGRLLASMVQTTILRKGASRI